MSQNFQPQNNIAAALTAYGSEPTTFRDVSSAIYNAPTPDAVQRHYSEAFANLNEGDDADAVVAEFSSAFAQATAMAALKSTTALGFAVDKRRERHEGDERSRFFAEHTKTIEAQAKAFVKAAKSLDGDLDVDRALEAKKSADLFTIRETLRAWSTWTSPNAPEFRDLGLGDDPRHVVLNHVTIDPDVDPADLRRWLSEAPTTDDALARVVAGRWPGVSLSILGGNVSEWAGPVVERHAANLAAYYDGQQQITDAMTFLSA